MPKHKQVKSGIQIGQEIAGFFEAFHPGKRRDEDFVDAVAKYNGIVNGRGSITPDELIHDLMSSGDDNNLAKVSAICNDIRDFITQKQMLSTPYGKSSAKEYKYKTFAIGSEKPLKIINQSIYDSAFNHGFPVNFFRESYFDGVVFYCIPDGTDFAFSRFSGCQFIVCGIRSACFDGTSFHDTQFHTVDMRHATFFTSTIAHTHFYDSSLSLVSFQKARLKSCNTRDCDMDRVGYLDAILDGCSYGSISATDIRHLDTAVITMGGATNEECENNRFSIFNALEVTIGK